MAKRNDDDKRNDYRIFFPNRLNYGQLIALRKSAAKNNFTLSIVIKSEERDGYYFTGTDEQVQTVIERLNKVADRFQYDSSPFRKYEIVSAIPDDTSMAEIVDQAVEQSSRDYLTIISRRDRQIRSLQGQVEHSVKERGRKEEESGLLVERARLLEERIALDGAKYQTEIEQLKKENAAGASPEPADLRSRLLQKIQNTFSHVTDIYSRALSGTTLTELANAPTQDPEEYASQLTIPYAKEQGVEEEKLLEIICTELVLPTTFASLTHGQYQKIMQEKEELERTINSAHEGVRTILEHNLRTEIEARKAKIAEYEITEQTHQQKMEIAQKIKTFYEEKLQEQRTRKERLQDNLVAYLELSSEAIPLLVEYTKAGGAMLVFPAQSKENTLATDLSDLLKEYVPKDWQAYNDKKGFGLRIDDNQYHNSSLQVLSSIMPLLQAFSDLTKQQLGIPIKPYFFAIEE